MITKAILKEDGLFIPGFVDPENAGSEEILVQIQILPQVPQQSSVITRINKWQTRLAGRNLGNVVVDIRKDRER